GDALLNLEIIRRMNIEVIETPDEGQRSRISSMLTACNFIIDGIFGTGLNSDVRGFYSQVITDVNSTGKPVMAIDIPSGLNADTGQVMGVSIKADLTVTFGFPKLGQLLFPGADLVGRLTRTDIGIPDSVSNEIDSKYKMIEPDDFSYLFNIEKRDIHKGSRGHLLVLAGSAGKTGAAVLTALGALRSGAGLVTVGIPESLNPVLEGKLTEAMTLPLPETSDGTLSLKAEKEIVKFMADKTAVAIGPGLSVNDETSALVRKIIGQTDIPMVIDADGLNALAGHLEVLAEYKGTGILTPHPGEMGKLTGVKNNDIQADRVGYAAGFAAEYGCYLVLKGAGTIVAEPYGKINVNPTGNQALSSGGTGDVLTGMIAGFQARGLTALKAAQAGVYMHGLAADFLAEEMGCSGYLT
ncbi:NAD(P)H-hydrate dehydratase, partial [Thermodesulfobacteriota bacterium]